MFPTPWISDGYLLGGLWVLSSRLALCMLLCISPRTLATECSLFIYLFIYLLIYLFIYLDVLSDSSVEEDRLLGHNPHLGADEGHVQCLHTLRLDLEIHMMGVGGVEGNIRSRK